MERWMSWILLQNGKVLVSELLDVRWQLMVVLPEVEILPDDS